MNNYNIFFGGRLMIYIDDMVFISVFCYCCMEIVIVLIDLVDFLKLIKNDYFVCLEFYVVLMGRSLMEIFVKIIVENLKIGECYLVVIFFLIFVVLDVDGKIVEVLFVKLEIEE